jgi:hypothetical protein
MIDNTSRILPLSLDGRQHTNRSLGYFVSELQLGSILQGSVSAITPSGNVLISTIYGKFSIENLFGLTKGDRISFTVSTDGENLFADITLINDIASKVTESVALSLVSRNKLDNTSIVEAAPIKVDINSKVPTNVPQNMKAMVSYLNLSNIDKDSIIHQMFANSPDIKSITFKVIKYDNSKTLLLHQLVGEVIESHNGGSTQSIKTSFGILSVSNAQMHLGKRIILEIQSIDNVSIYDKLNMLNINDFLFKLNNHWSALKNLLDNFKIFKIRNDSTQGSIIKDAPKESLKKLLDSQLDKQELRILSESLNKLKELYMMPCIKREDENSWYPFLMPIFDGEKIIHNKVYTQRKKNGVLRFIIELSLEIFGEIQIDGYVKLNSSTLPESLDLTIRFKGLVNTELQGKISEMFDLYQNLSGIRGVLNFQQVHNFVDFNKN